MAHDIASTAPSPGTSAQSTARRVVLLVATRKGAWLYHGDAARGSWRSDGPHFLCALQWFAFAAIAFFGPLIYWRHSRQAAAVK